MTRRYIFEINKKHNIREFIQPLEQILYEERQHKVFNGQVSTWINITAGVPTFLVHYCFQSLKMISLKVFLRMRSYLQTIHLYFPL